jgi:hypothetical protein
MFPIKHRVYFKSPVPADIAVFDECNFNILARVINSDLKTTIINQRPPEVWLGLRVLLNVFLTLGAMSWTEISAHPGGKWRGILREIKRTYFLACIKTISPKAVITIIDNSSTFGWMAKHCRDFPFIGIQNGSRLSYAIGIEPPVYHQHLFCFGSHEVEHLPEYGWEVEHFYPVGSLLASLYFTHPPGNVETRYELLLASSWRGNIGFPLDVQDTMASMRTLDILLAEYLRIRNLRAAVILRSERDSEHWYMPELGQNEAQYYETIYGDSLEIIETSTSTRNIFSLMEASDLVVGCLTTALIEALGIGKKIQFFNFTGKDIYHRDFKSPLVFTNPDPEAFTRKMDDLIAMDADDANQYFQDLAGYYMAIDPQVPAFRHIAETIDGIIERNPAYV